MAYPSASVSLTSPGPSHSRNSHSLGTIFSARSRGVQASDCAAAARLQRYQDKPFFPVPASSCDIPESNQTVGTILAGTASGCSLILACVAAAQ
mgnify:CR=1 FL=1